MPHFLPPARRPQPLQLRQRLRNNSLSGISSCFIDVPGEAARLIFMDWLNFEELLLEQQQEKTSPLSTVHVGCCCFCSNRSCPEFYDNGYFSLITSWFYELEGGNDMAPLLMPTLDIIIFSSSSSSFFLSPLSIWRKKRTVIIYVSLAKGALLSHHRGDIAGRGRHHRCAPPIWRATSQIE